MAGAFVRTAVLALSVPASAIAADLPARPLPVKAPVMAPVAGSRLTTTVTQPVAELVEVTGDSLTAVAASPPGLVPW